MRRQRTFKNYSNSFLQHLNNDEENQVSSNNFVNNEQYQATNLKKLSSSIISSADITRESLLQGPNIMSRSNYDVIVDDDDDKFFQKIKSDIDKDLLENSKENYKLNSIQRDIFSLRKKRPIIDEETQNIIKRFKKDANIDHTNFMQTPANNISIMKSNSVFNDTIRCPYEAPQNISGIENIMNQQNTKRYPMYNVPTSTYNVGNIVRQKSTINCPMYNLPSTNDVGDIVRQKETIRCPYNLPVSTNDVGPTVRQENTISCPKYNLLSNGNTVGNIIMKPQTIFMSKDLHIRNPNKYVFQMCSKMQKDKILPLNKIKTAVVRTECKEVLYYSTTYFTPPKRNCNEDD